MDKNKLFFFSSITIIFFVWMYFGTQQQKKELAKQNVLESTSTLDSNSTPSATTFTQKKVNQIQNNQFDTVQQQLKQPISKIITVSTKVMQVEFLENTGEVHRITLNSLFKNDTNHYTILDPTHGEHFSLGLEGKNLKDLSWTSSTTQSKFNLTHDSLTLVFKATLPNGVFFERYYTLFSDKNTIHHQFKTNANIDGLSSIYWTGGINETEEKIAEGGLGEVNYDEFIFSNGETVSREQISKPTSFNDGEGSVKWYGLRRKYVAAILNFNHNQDYKIRVKPLTYQTKNEFNDITENVSSYQIILRNKNFIPSTFDFDILIIPLQYTHIKSYNQGYEKILFSGYEWFFRADIWYVKLAGFVLNLLNWFYSIIPNYGIAIICLTLLIRCLLLPFTIMQTKSMGKLQEHAPAIKQIRQDNKSNPQKAQKEIMAYYKTKGVNPVAGMLGCLPMIFQFPVFIALFHVLGRAVELKGVPFLFWITDLSQPDVVLSSFVIPYIFPTGLTILPFFMALTMFFQTKLTMTDPNQKMLVWMMPLLMFVFSASFPSGLVLYWTISNVFTIIQTKIIKKKPKIV